MMLLKKTAHENSIQNTVKIILYMVSYQGQRKVVNSGMSN